jgi:hypothetical protein
VINRLRPLPRRRATLATWLADRLEPGHHIRLEYPPAPRRTNRHGYGKPSHPGLTQLLSQEDGLIAGELGRLMEWEHELAAIPTRAVSPTEPHWDNGFLFGLDGATIYSFLRQRCPSTYLEIGSGNSTLFAARARRDGRLETRLVSIDPAPRREIDRLCDRVLRSPLQDVPLDLFAALEPGDVVLFDGTHRVFTNSDATVFFLEVMPLLPAGVLVGIHDIHLPDDYRPEHYERYYSEQYLLAAYLLAGCPWLRPVLPLWYVHSSPSLHQIVQPLLDRPPLASASRPGSLFWLAVDR